jgi:methionyl aminopeptidase
MSITTEQELLGMQLIGNIVGSVLKKMREYASPGMSTRELDEFGGQLLASYGAKSAPQVMYKFPGFTCISINNEVAHGIPSESKILKEGDLVNIDVSAELNGFFSDNGGSFVLGNDINGHQPLVDTSRRILYKALSEIKGGVRIADIGRLIESEARKSGYKVIRNLVGHGVGRSLHEEPNEIPCFWDPHNKGRFKKNSVIALETFISTQATFAVEGRDGWTLTGKGGGFVAQHEHTLIVTDGQPVILTAANEI